MIVNGRAVNAYNDATDSEGYALPPLATDLEIGQIAVHTSNTDPSIFFKTSTGVVVKIPTEAVLVRALQDILGSAATDLATLKELLAQFQGSENDIIPMIAKLAEQVAAFEGHVSNTNNPHNVTAAQVGALPASGTAEGAKHVRIFEIVGFVGKTVGELKEEIRQHINNYADRGLFVINVRGVGLSFLNNFNNDNVVLMAGNTYLYIEVTCATHNFAHIKLTTYAGKAFYQATLTSGTWGSIFKIMNTDDTAASADSFTKRNVVSGTNLDTLKTNGYYIIREGVINAPVTNTMGGRMMVYSWDDNAVTQMYFDHGANETYFRRCFSTWQPWCKLYHDKNLNNATTDFTAKNLKVEGVIKRKSSNPFILFNAVDDSDNWTYAMTKDGFYPINGQPLGTPSNRWGTMFSDIAVMGNTSVGAHAIGFNRNVVTGDIYNKTIQAWTFQQGGSTNTPNDSLNLRFYNKDGVLLDSNVITALGNGNVGIGGRPNAKADIFGNMMITNPYNTDPKGTAGLHIRNTKHGGNENNYTGITFSPSNDEIKGAAILVKHNGGSGSALEFYTSNMWAENAGFTKRATITPMGWFGIGVDPQDKFHLDGDALINGWVRFVKDSEAYLIKTNRTDGTYTSGVKTDGFNMFFVTNGISRMFMGANGNVGIGNFNNGNQPAALLDVWGTTRLRGSTTMTDNLTLETTGSNRDIIFRDLSVTSGRNEMLVIRCSNTLVSNEFWSPMNKPFWFVNDVGINTPEPKYPLDVNGAVRGIKVITNTVSANSGNIINIDAETRGETMILQLVNKNWSAGIASISGAFQIRVNGVTDVVAQFGKDKVDFYTNAQFKGSVVAQGDVIARATGAIKFAASEGGGATRLNDLTDIKIPANIRERMVLYYDPSQVNSDGTRGGYTFDQAVGVTTGKVTAQDVESLPNFNLVAKDYTSDKRLKENATDLNASVLLSLEPKRFTWNEKAAQLELFGDSFGLMAQDVANHIPEIIIDLNGEYKGVDYTKLIPFLIQGYKDLHNEITKINRRK